MAAPSFEDLFEDLIEDADLRESFVSDPVATLRAQGYDLDEADVERFESIDWRAVEQAFRHLGRNLLIT